MFRIKSSCCHFGSSSRFGSRAQVAIIRFRVVLSVGMVCSNCGELGHNAKTCAAPLRTDHDSTKRGLRESPRTPTEAAKIAKLADLAKKMSPAPVPPLPGQPIQMNIATPSQEGQPQAGSSSGVNDRTGDPTVRTLDSEFLQSSKGVVGETKEENKKKEGESEHGKVEPSNADIMERLGKMMTNMVVKEDLTALKSDITQETKTTISEAVEPLKNEIADIKKDVGGIDVRLTNLEAGSPGSASTVDRSVLGKIAALETQLNDLRRASQQEFVAVFGNLDRAVKEEEAISFVGGKITEAGIAKPSAVYPKGSYIGYLYAKFKTKGDRDACVERLRKDRISHNESKVWVDEERPKGDRAIRGFLFGLKTLLTSETWDYTRKAVWVDTESHQIYLGNDIMATAQIKDGAFEVKYEPGWAEYLKDPKLETLEATAKKRMTSGDGKKGASKAKGKGATSQ